MDMKRYMINQIQEALKHKWYEGVRTGKDPGEQAVSEWISKHAAEYRQEYEKCLNTLVDKIITNAEKRIPKVCPLCSKEKLNGITKIIIEEFTDLWFLEMSKPTHDKHLEEI